MVKVSRTRMQHYGMAVLAVGAALLLMLIFNRWISMAESPFLLFFGAVMVSAWYGGLKPGLVACILSALVSYSFFIQTSLVGSSSHAEIFRIGLFVLEGILVSVLCEALRRARSQAEASLRSLQANQTSLQTVSENVTRILESITDGFLALDDEWRLTYINRRAEQTVGRIGHDLIGRVIWDEYPALIGSTFYQHCHRAIAEQTPILFEAQGILATDAAQGASATDRWFEVRAYPSQHGLAIYFQEITDRRRSQAALIESEERLRLTLDAAEMGLWNYDLRSHDLYWSERHAQMFGRAADYPVTYDLFLESVHPDDRERVRQAVMQVITNQENLDLEYRVRPPDGHIRWLAAIGRAYYTDSGEPARLMGVTFDITERKQTEASLRRSEERLRVALKNSPITVFNQDWDLRYTWLYNHPVIGEQEDEAIIGKRDEELLPAEEAEFIVGLKRRVLETGIGTREEIKIPLQDTSFYFDLTVEPLRNEIGDVVGITCAAIDITERKTTELALRFSETLLNALLASSPIGFVFLDTQFRFVHANEAIATINGLTIADHIGRTLQEVLPDYAAQIMAVAQEVIQTRQPVMYQEMSGNNAQGIHHHCLVSYYPVCLPDGQLLGVGITVMDVTELKRIEQALRESEMRFKRLVQSNLVGCIFWEDNGSITDANNAFLEMVGYTRDDLQAGRVNWKEMTPPEQLYLSEEAIAQMRERVAANPLEKEYIRKDGSRVPVLLGGVMFEGSQERGVSFVIDLTERKKAEAALRESEERYRLLAEALPQFVWVTNLAGQMEYCNQYWYDYTGLTQEQTLGAQWYMAMHPDDLPRVLEQWQQALRTRENYDVEYRIQRVSGDYRWFLASVGPACDRQGHIIKWVGTAIDIDDRKRVEAERAELLAREQVARTEAELARGAAESANRIKDEFLAVLSHELRTPLNPILGWSKLLRDRRFDDATTARALETIERNAKLQTQLIEDLLDVSRILQGKLSINIATVDLNAIIEAALETMCLAAEAKSIHIHALLNPAVGQVAGDPNRLQQVVWNLLSNSVKFTPPGGQIWIQLSVITGEEALRPYEGTVGEWQLPVSPDEASGPAAVLPSSSEAIARGHTDYAQIVVQDTGQGIAPNFLPYVFDYFRQADSATTRKFGGLGLGLAIVRRLVELHGGTITAHSAGEGLGATFVVRLPLLTQHRDVLDSSYLQAKQATSSAPSVLNGKRILVVDDEGDTRDLLAFMLQQTGAIVTTAASAQDALRYLKDSTPDVVLSDIAMPGVDGYGLIQRIRSSHAPSVRGVPAIALTAYASDIDQQRSLEAGFQKHLAKPVEPAELFDAIAQLLAQAP